jgi:integrase
MRTFEASECNPRASSCAIVRVKADTGASLRGDFERMARRRFQQPTPVKRGKWWTLRVWKDTFIDGKLTRIRERVRLAPATLGEREVLKRAQKHLEPINHSIAAVGSATNFNHYVERTYKPIVLALMAKTTKERYEGIIKDYLSPVFGSLCLGDLSVLTAQRYFSNTKNFAGLGHESIDKIRDVLSSILRSSVEYGLIEKNPIENVRIPRAKSGKKAKKPHVTPEQFSQIIAGIPEPYATMVYVAVWTGLRVSELIGLRWEDVHTDSLTIDERYCRGDWAEPKSDASNATIGVDLHVIARIERLKTLTVTVRAGRAKRKYRVVKSAKPHDLVFQSVKDGKPMRDNNILTRFIKPAARAVGLEWVNWRCLRTSRATWMIEAGANPKDVQGQMRHSRISTTMDIYAQFVPESARRAMERTREMVERRTAAMQPSATQAVQ